MSNLNVHRIIRNIQWKERLMLGFSSTRRATFSHRCYSSSRLTPSVVQDHVKRNDYDGYMCGLLFPQRVRPAYFALRAFNAEIAMIKDKLRDTSISGKLRLNWWRARIDDVYKEMPLPDHPFLQPLAQAIHEFELSRIWIDRILDEREEDLEIDQPDTMDDLRKYIERTQGSLLYLTLELFHIRSDDADRTASSLARGMGLASTLRGLPFHLSRRQTYIPKDALVEHGLNLEILATALKDKKTAEQCSRLVQSITLEALASIEEGRSKAKMLSGSQAPFLNSVSSSNFLRTVQTTHYDLSNPSIYEQKKLPLQLQMWRHSLFGTF